MTALIHALEEQGDLIEQQMRVVQGRSLEMVWDSGAARAMTRSLEDVVSHLAAGAREARVSAHECRAYLVRAEEARKMDDANAALLGLTPAVIR